MDELGEVCGYCEKPGQLFPIRGRPGLYHLRCMDDAKKALETARGKSLIGILVKGATKR